jgi:antitoxin component YwqK of YwqJK toxin-antitoxin module
MNKTLIIFFTILFCLTSSISWSLSLNDLFEIKGIYYNKLTEVPFTGKIDGKTKGSFKNGKRDGSWLSYWANGKLKSKGNYKNDNLEGSWTEYYDNGQLFYKGKYKDWLEEGYWVMYWENGQLKSKGNYKRGSQEGSWIYYNEDGTIWEDATGTYRNGKMISE